jgi:Cof subfamily protein (haloacid dehalogenase superfamily)
MNLKITDMRYKMIVLDLDGTLTNSKKEITPKTYEALMAAQERGVKVVLASGRPTYGIAPLADQLQLHNFGGYILAFNGGEIYNWETKGLVHAIVLNPEVLPYAYNCAKENDFTILTYKDNDIICENPDDEYVQKEVKINKMGTKKVDSFLETVDFQVAKCLIVGDSSRLILLEQEMKAKLQETNEIYRSEPYFLEVLPKGIDKAQTLAVLLDKLGLTKEEVIACGDGFNDLSMVKFAGLGVAMANAQDIVKENADYITLSNDEDGIAHVIEKFIFS